jgi:sarcosine oxidase
VPAWFDHLFFLILVVLFPLRAARSGIRRLRRATPAELPRVRLAVYHEAILIQWSLLAAMIAIWIATGRAWEAVGVTARVTPAFGIMALLAAVAIGVTLHQRRQALTDDDTLMDVRRKMEHLEVMLPHAPHELGVFYRLSFTAGVCEEVLYRGYLIWYLALWMPPVAAAAAASVIFGFGHAYQGRRGVLTTGLFGAVLAAVYLISGSLWIPIVLHVLIDAHSGHLAFHAFRRGAELDRQRIEREAEERMAAREAAAAAPLAPPDAEPGMEPGAVPGVEPEAAAGAASQAVPAAPAPAFGPGPAAVRADYDVAIVGLGAMGGAAAHQLAARGVSVIGFDRWRPPHDRGSSHGETRLIREAYFEAPFYVPIVQRAFELWTALEAESGTPLLRLTGGLMIGPPDAALVSGAARSAEVHGLPHERIDAAEVRRRYPGLQPEDHTVAIWEPRTGMLFPEACVAAHLDGAARRGATLRYGEEAIRWRADGDGVEVETATGRVRAARLVLAGGAWMPALLGQAGLPLRVSRQTLHWFEPVAEPERFDPERCPAWIYEHAPGIFTYGFPRLHGAVKAAMHVPGETVDPDTIAREIAPEEAAALVGALRQYAPDIAGRQLKSAVCMYTNTPDMHFAIDRHPQHEQVVVVSACSGHGFKFATALGEVVADLATGRAPRFDLTPFRIARFASGETAAPVR